MNETIVFFVNLNKSSSNNLLFWAILSAVGIFVIQKIILLFWIYPYKNIKKNISYLYDSIYINQKKFDALPRFIENISIQEKENYDKIYLEVKTNWSKLKSNYYQLNNSKLLLLLKGLSFFKLKSFLTEKEFNELNNKMNDLLNNSCLYYTNKKGYKNNEIEESSAKRGKLTRELLEVLEKYS